MYEYDSRVRLSEVDQNQKMTLIAILNSFQDCSTFHSEDLGVGLKLLDSRKRMWVLISWDICIQRCPNLCEHIKVATWPYEFGRGTGKRNFRILGEDKGLAAWADSLWAFVDTESMRPVRVDKDIISAYQLEPRLSMEYRTGKIQLPEDMEAQNPFPIHIYHLDVNHHVNNGQYVLLAAQYLPEGFSIRKLRAEYKKSAILGDIIYPRAGKLKDGYAISLEDEAGRPYAVLEFR